MHLHFYASSTGPGSRGGPEETPQWVTRMYLVGPSSIDCLGAACVPGCLQTASRCPSSLQECNSMPAAGNSPALPAGDGKAGSAENSTTERPEGLHACVCKA